MIDIVRERFLQSRDVADATLDHLGERLVDAAELIVSVYRSGGGVYLFGNGGSAADAQHIAGELVGRFLKERRALKAEALSTNTSILTALGNDYSFDIIFARQLEANAAPGDVAVGLSTSGNSGNVVSALAKAREIGMKTIAITGEGGGICVDLADVLLDVPSRQTPRVQESTLIMYHILCELVEDAIAEDE